MHTHIYIYISTPTLLFESKNHVSINSCKVDLLNCCSEPHGVCYSHSRGICDGFSLCVLPKLIVPDSAVRIVHIHMVTHSLIATNSVWYLWDTAQANQWAAQWMCMNIWHCQATLTPTRRPVISAAPSLPRPLTFEGYSSLEGSPL